MGGSKLKTFTKRHIRFYIICFLCGFLISTVGSNLEDLYGLIPFTLGIIISIFSVIGILFFRKGDE